MTLMISARIQYALRLGLLGLFPWIFSGMPYAFAQNSSAETAAGQTRTNQFRMVAVSSLNDVCKRTHGTHYQWTHGRHFSEHGGHQTFENKLEPLSLDSKIVADGIVGGCWTPPFVDSIGAKTQMLADKPLYHTDLCNVGSPYMPQYGAKVTVRCIVPARARAGEGAVPQNALESSLGAQQVSQPGRQNESEQDRSDRASGAASEETP